MSMRALRRAPLVSVLLSVQSVRPAGAFAAYSISSAASAPSAQREPAAPSVAPMAGLGDPALRRLAMRTKHVLPAAAESARAAAARALELEAALAARRPRRLILTSSSSGISAEETRRVLEQMLHDFRTERLSAEGGSQQDLGPPRIAFVLTAALAGSTERVSGQAEAVEALADASSLPATAAMPEGAEGSADEEEAEEEDGEEESPPPPSASFSAASAEALPAQPARSRSAGEARRRRLASARRKAKLLCAAVGASVGGWVDLQAVVAEEERAYDLLHPQRAAEGLERARAVRDASAARLLAGLSTSHAVWVLGGNTFHLRHWMAQSGFDAVLLQLVGQNGLPYIGQSAGAIVAGVSAQVALWKGWDDPAAAPPPTGLEPPEPSGELLAAIEAASPPALVVGARPPSAATWTLTRLAGVGLVPVSCFPHYGPRWAALCDRLQATELRAAAATAAALGIAADVADEPSLAASVASAGGLVSGGGGAGAAEQPAAAAALAAAGESLSSLVRLRDGESFIWDESQPHVHRSIIGTPERDDEPWPPPAAADAAPAARAGAVPPAPALAEQSAELLGRMGQADSADIDRGDAPPNAPPGAGG